MKAKISPAIFLIVSASLSFIASIALAEGSYTDWAYAINDGNVPVILHIKTGENKYTEIQLEPGKFIVLPAGSQKVTAFPVNGRLEKGEYMRVETNLFTKSSDHPSLVITEPGKSVKFPRPSIAATPELRKALKDDVIFAPGALASAEEKCVRQETPIDDKEFLREQNKMYMEKKKWLEELEKADPKSTEAGRIRDALDMWEKDINRMAKEAEAKYGPDWKENYRDSKGKLPGGFIEDNKSRLVKLQEKRNEQKDKVDGLKSEFEKLKKRLKSVEPRWEDRLEKDQQEFRDKFIKEHGSPDTWDEETRKKYEEGFNNLTGKEQWEKDKAEQAEVNRAIGRKIKEIAQEQAELNEIDKVIELQNKRIAEKPSTNPAIPFVIDENAGVVKAPSLENKENVEEACSAPSAPGKGPASKSSEDEQFTLKVITVTANNDRADMDSGLRAYIMINGQETLKQELDDPEDDFEPGATDTFERTFNIPLSEVKSISLVVDGDDEWLCEQVSFQFFTKDKMSNTYAFRINTWFSGESKDMNELGAVKSKTFNINPSADGLLERQ